MHKSDNALVIDDENKTIQGVKLSSEYFFVIKKIILIRWQQPVFNSVDKATVEVLEMEMKSDMECFNQYFKSKTGYDWKEYSKMARKINDIF